MNPPPSFVPTRTRYGVVGLTLALTAIAYLDRVRIAMAAPAIKSDLHLTDAQLGYIFSAFTFGYALFEIPSGWMADRWGPRLTLARVVVWWSLMSALTGFAAGFWSLFLIRLLFGMGEAGTFPGISRVYSRWLPSRERGRAFGLVLMTGALGGAVSQPLIAWCLSFTTWRVLFPAFSIVGLAWAGIWFGWFRNDPHRHPRINQAELELIGSAPPSFQPATPWQAIFRSRSLLALCVVCGSWLYGWYFWLTWLPSYLLRARGFDLKHAGWLAGLPLLASAIGVLGGGWLSDLLAKRWGLKRGRRAPGLIFLPLAVAAMLAGIFASSGLTCVLFFSSAAGLAAAGQTAVFPACLEIAGRHAGVVTGAMNMVGNLFGALCPLFVGGCLQHGLSWNVPLGSVAGLYLIACVAWLFIDPAAAIDPV